MLSRCLADGVVALHGLIGMFFLFGAILCWRYPWVALIHVPLAAWVSAAFVMGWTCPLTPLENRLRKAAGEQGYQGSFVDHYLGRLVGGSPPAGEPKPTRGGRRKEIILGVFFGIISLVLHGANFARYHDAIWPPSRKPPAPPTAHQV